MYRNGFRLTLPEVPHRGHFEVEKARSITQSACCAKVNPNSFFPQRDLIPHEGGNPTVVRTPRPKVKPAAQTEDPGATRKAVLVTRRPRTKGNVNKAWFEARREEVQISLRQLATKIGMDVAALSRTFDGKRTLTAEEAGRIAHYLKVPVEAVLANAGVDVRGIQSGAIGIRGWVAPDGRVTFGPVRGPGAVVGPSGVQDGTVALRVQGGVWNGCVLFYREGQGVTPEAVGKLCVLAIKEERGELRVGWLIPGYEAGRWEILPLDRTDEPRGDAVVVEMASPVMWIKQSAL